MKKYILNNKIWIFISIIFILNIILKIIFLKDNDLAGDEPFTVFNSQGSLHDISSMLKDENNPPLHFFLIHFWIKIFGISTFAVRFPSLIFSSFTVIYLFIFGNKYYNFKTGVLAAILFTLSSFQFYFSHEARVYSLMGFLIIASLYYFISLLIDHNFKRNLILLTIVNILLIYSHYFGIFLIIIEFLSVLFFHEYRKKIKPYLLSLAVCIIAFAPILIIFYYRLGTSINNGTWVSKPHFNDSYFKFKGFVNSPVNAVATISILIVSLILWTIKDKKVNSATKPVLLVFPGLFIAMFFVSYWIPMFIDRYLISCSIGLILIIAISIGILTENKKLKFIIPVMALGLYLPGFSLNPKNNEDIDKAAEYIKSVKDSKTVVIICPPWSKNGFTYYYNRSFFQAYKNMDKMLENDNILPVYNYNNIDTNLINNANKVLFFDNWADIVDPDKTIFNGISKKMNLADTKSFYKILKVYVFIKN